MPKKPASTVYSSSVGSGSMSEYGSSDIESTISCLPSNKSGKSYALVNAALVCGGLSLTMFLIYLLYTKIEKLQKNVDKLHDDTEEELVGLIRNQIQHLIQPIVPQQQSQQTVSTSPPQPYVVATQELPQQGPSTEIIDSPSVFEVPEQQPLNIVDSSPMERWKPEPSESPNLPETVIDSPIESDVITMQDPTTTKKAGKMKSTIKVVPLTEK